VDLFTKFDEDCWVSVNTGTQFEDCRVSVNIGTQFEDCRVSVNTGTQLQYLARLHPHNVAATTAQLLLKILHAETKTQA
jgi:hypothetical protein